MENISLDEMLETTLMFDEENLDIRTVTIGISLLSCMSTSVDTLCKNIENKIYKYAKN